MRYDKRIAALDGALRVDESFDLIRRPITVGGYQGVMYMVDGFVKDDIMEKVMEFMMSAERKAVDALTAPRAFADRFISYVETDICRDIDETVTAVLSGTLALAVERYDCIFLIDARTYPSRGVEEPDDDRVLRGSHDGFTETLVMNTALIRRRIRDPRLTVSVRRIGGSSRTDVAVLYISGRADRSFLRRLDMLLSSLDVDSLTMAQESLNEALNRRGWFNPFPKVRYTERPDAAAACVLEGKILVLVDNSPSAMVLPTAIFDFLQDANDFYFPPVVGTYLRWIRALMFAVTLFLTPVWLLLVQNSGSLPQWLSFIAIDEPAKLPLVAQLLLFEFVMDGLKLASLNTPSSLSNSFSVIGALILGEFAVSSGLFCPDTILYMSFTAIGNFTQPSFELGYAFKLMRIIMIVLISLFGIWGFIGGAALLVFLLAVNPTVSRKSYLYPLVPFNAKDLAALLLRKRNGNRQ